jgi:hypothetical protein
LPDATSSTQADEVVQGREKEVLYALLSDPGPWSMGELERDLGSEWTSDAVDLLDRAGLVHRYEVQGGGANEKATIEFVVTTPAARRAHRVYDEAV